MGRWFLKPQSWKGDNFWNHNCEFWLRICKQVPKLSYWPSKVWGVHDAHLRRYKRLKIEISTENNRKFFNTFKNFFYRGSTCRNFLTYPDIIYQDRDWTSPLPSPRQEGARGRLYTLGCSTRVCEKNFQKSLLVMLKISIFEILKYYALQKIEF